MKKLLSAILLIAFCAAAPHAHAAYAFVAAASNNKGSSGTSDVVPYAPTAGNGLFIVVAYQDSTHGSAIPMVASGSGGLKDQSGNPIPFIESGSGYQNVGNGYGFHFLYAPNVGSGITTITATLAFNAGSGIGLGVAEYSGLTNVVDAQAHNDGQSAANTSADTVTSTTMTPTGATGGAILIGFCGSFSAFETATAGTGFTNRTGTGWVIPAQGGLEDKRITSNTAVAATYTAIATGHVYSTYAFTVDEGSAVTAAPTNGGFSTIAKNIGSDHARF